ncbi:MAG: PolC-type DNA polymerase III [Piscinibacter sp.]|uniref:3'-5' exonuclease n=1 Tax=Piscinibacter sp. TaxID=1903157 RepID=UPI003D12DB05
MIGWFSRRTARADDDGRWVVLDVESSGLDPKRDRLLAIAAIALRREAEGGPRVVLADSFEVVLRQPEVAVDKANILVHGIGVGAQRQGVEPAQALEAFERWAGAAPLFGFHVAFDEALIQRAMRAALGRSLPNAWIDVADVAQVVRPDVPGRSLDEWMEALGIRCAVRHQAAADTLATAELLLGLWPQVVAQKQGDDWRALSRLAAQRRWLPR